MSKAQADVKELEAALSAAQTKESLVKAGDATVGALTSAPIVREGTEFLRRRTGADAASATADVDRITADLITAQNRLKWAQRTADALDTVSSKVSDFLDAIDDAMDTDEAPPVESAIEVASTIEARADDAADSASGSGS